MLSALFPPLPKRLARWTLPLVLCVGTLGMQPGIVSGGLLKGPVEQSETDADQAAKEWNVSRREYRSAGSIVRSFYPGRMNQHSYLPSWFLNNSSGSRARPLLGRRQLLGGGQHALRNGLGAPLLT